MAQHCLGLSGFTNLKCFWVTYIESLPIYLLSICVTFSPRTECNSAGFSKYSWDLNTDHLNTELFGDLISKGQFMCHVLCTRLTIQIPIQS